MNDKNKAMTIRIPEGAYDLLLELEEGDGLAPAIRVRKLLLDYLDWSRTRKLSSGSRPKATSQTTSKASPDVRRKNPEGTRSERRSKKSQNDPAADIADEIKQVSRWEKR